MSTTPQTPTSSASSSTGPGFAFEAAFIALKGGQRIRRASWPAGIFINLDAAYQWPGEAKPTGNIQRHDNNGPGQYMALSSRDLLANDWEII